MNLIYIAIGIIFITIGIYLMIKGFSLFKESLAQKETTKSKFSFIISELLDSYLLSTHTTIGFALLFLGVLFMGSGLNLFK